MSDWQGGPLPVSVTCLYYTLALRAAGWDDLPRSVAEQRTFTNGHIVPVGDKIHRLQQQWADYLLRCIRDFTLAVVEAKAEDHEAHERTRRT